MQYARLESSGVWRPVPGAQRQDVVVAFGDSSLVISDRSGRALAHWSLAAVARINPGIQPAVYTPSAEATEVLEIADDIMTDAIETVRLAVERARPRQGRLRGAIFALALGAIIAVGAWILPDALVRHSLAALPEPTRTEIDESVARAITRVAGVPCSTPRGTRSLARLQARLAPEGLPGSAGLHIVRDAVEGALALPGGTILLSSALVEDYEAAEVVAGHILAAQVRAATTPPLAELLSGAGPRAIVRLLTTGHLPEGVAEAHAETLLSARPSEPDDAALLAAFARANVSTRPYADARDVTGETVLPLIEGDPLRGAPGQPLLSDGDWVALQGICGN